MVRECDLHFVPRVQVHGSTFFTHGGRNNLSEIIDRVRRICTHIENLVPCGRVIHGCRDARGDVADVRGRAHLRSSPKIVMVRRTAIDS